MQKNYLTLLFTLICLNITLSSSYGQSFDGQQLVKTGLTPEPYSLFKQTDIPMDYSRGVADISIPLYRFVLNNYELPISINYHSSGIKVDETASTVGLGWSLNAGGSISSVVNGISDMDTYGWYRNRFILPEDRVLEPKLTREGNSNYFENADYTLCKFLTGNPVVPKGGPGGGEQPVHDTEPDLFYYKMGPISGKFFFGQDKGIYTIPYIGVHIDYAPNLFVIYDESGNKFTFDVIENSTTFSTVYTNNDAFNVYSKPIKNKTYHLSSIVTPDGESITFEYTEILYRYDNPRQYTRYRALGKYMDNLSMDAETYADSYVEVRGKFLSRIYSSKGDQVKINYRSCPRLDLPSGTYNHVQYVASRAIKDIEILNNNESKKVNFYHSYFNFNGNYIECTSQVSDPNSVRLRLDSLKFSGQPSHRFYYHGNDLSPRNTEQFDHWGYASFNGGRYFSEPEKGFTINTGTRTPNYPDAVKGTLRKIVYPTGGSRVFDYELNDYADTTSGFKNTLVYRSASYYFESGVSKKEVPFTISPNVNGTSLQINYNTTIAPAQANLQFNVSIKGEGSKIWWFQSISGPRREFISLPSGNYKLIVQQVGNFEDGYAIVSWNENIQVETEPVINSFAGGLRIKTIMDYTGDELNLAKQRRFEYRKGGDRSQSSGHLYNKPRYSYQMTKYKRIPRAYDPQVPEDTEAPYYAQNARSITPLNGFSGSSIIYSNVREYYNVEGTTGFVDYNYSVVKDLSVFDPSMFVQPISYDFMRGHLLQKEVYKRDPSTNLTELVSREQNFYEYNYTPPSGTASEFGEHLTNPAQPNEKHVIGIRIKVDKPEYYEFVTRWPAVFDIATYKLISSWTYLDSTVSTTFDGGNPIIETTKYVYSNPTHGQVKQIRSNSSVSTETMVQNFAYALDFPNISGFIGDMKNKHILNKPIERVTYRSRGDQTSIVKGEIMNYFSGNLLEKVFQINTISPISNLTFKYSNRLLGKSETTGLPTSYLPDSRYELYFQVNSRDAYGNPSEVKEYFKPNVVYLWGYNGQYPVAKIENSTYAGVLAVLGQSAINNLNAPNVSEEVVRSILNTLRNHSNMQDSQITGYTYSPLVGMTSMTDPRGITEYYQYDGFQRLKDVLDFEKNVLMDYQYHYRP